MSGEILYRSLLDSKVKYSEKMVRRSLIVIRHSSNERLVEKHKRFIFECSCKIIVRNTNNFFNLIKNVECGQVIHEKDDIVNECFLIMNKCLSKFNLKEKKYKFYFYVNKSISQGLYRMKERNYGLSTGKYSYINAGDVVEYEKKTFTHINNYPLFLEKNFSNKEILLMQSKLQEEKIEDFIIKAEITKSEYYRILKSVKSKIGKKYLS